MCESNSIMDNIQQKVKNCWDDLPIFDINSYWNEYVAIHIDCKPPRNIT